MRHSVKLTLLAVSVACIAASGGCMSERDSKALGEAITAPIAAMARSITDAQDLACTAAAFRRKNNRWPTDYAELSGFVEQTDGLLCLKQYDRVTFTSLPEDRFQIAFVPDGQTNELTIILETERCK